VDLTRAIEVARALTIIVSAAQASGDTKYPDWRGGPGAIRSCELRPRRRVQPDLSTALSKAMAEIAAGRGRLSNAITCSCVLRDVSASCVPTLRSLFRSTSLPLQDSPSARHSHDTVLQIPWRVKNQPFAASINTR